MPSDPSRTTRSVLCVLADATLRESIRAPLSAAGWQVVEASCVLEALSVSRAQRPDIVVLECGIEGARQLIDQMAGRAVPLIAVGSAESCQRAVSAGAVDWIVPPVTGELLVHRVEAVLRAALSDRELVGLRAQFTAEDGGGEATPAATPRESFLRRADAILRDPRQRGDNAAMLVLSVRDRRPRGGAGCPGRVPADAGAALERRAARGGWRRRGRARRSGPAEPVGRLRVRGPARAAGAHAGVLQGGAPDPARAGSAGRARQLASIPGAGRHGDRRASRERGRGDRALRGRAPVDGPGTPGAAARDPLRDGRDEREHVRTPDAGVEPAPRAGARGADSLLPAAHRAGDRPDRLHGGAAALEAPRAGPGLPRATSSR